MLPESYHDMCAKCRNRKKCEEPCWPVEALLRDGGNVHEVKGKDTIMVFPKHKEVQDCVIREYCESETFEDEYSMADELFSSECDTPWAHANYKLDRTNVFILRVFKRWSWQDIAIYFDTDSERVRGLYKDSVGQLLKALKVMDNRRSIVDDAKSRLAISEKASGKMPKTHKWFLLNKVFGLLPREIAEMYDANVSTVCGRIKDVADKVIAGQITFMDPSPQEVKQAQGRIEAKRSRDRKQWAARQAK